MMLTGTLQLLHLIYSVCQMNVIKISIFHDQTADRIDHRYIPLCLSLNLLVYLHLEYRSYCPSAERICQFHQGMKVNDVVNIKQ